MFDAQGCALGPGLVDIGTRIQTLFGAGKETLRSLDRAALSAGVTTLIVSPAMNPVLDTPEAMIGFSAEALHSISQIRALGGLTRDLAGLHMAEIGLMAEQGIAGLSDGGQPIVDSHLLHQILTYAAGFGLPVMLSALDPHFAKAVATGGEMAARLGLTSVPEGVEAIAAHRLLGIAGLSGGKTILGGISVPHTLIPIAEARDRGQYVFAAADIHHLTLNEVDAGDLNTACKFTPPLRAEIDRKLLVEGLKEGLIDIISSGHNPCGLMQKFTPFAEAASGSSNIESMLPAALGLYHSGEIELETLWRAMSATPARAMGVEAAALRVGSPADLTLVDLDAPFVLRAEALKSASTQTAYDGRRLQGRVLKTWRKGRLVYDLEQEQVVPC